MQKNIIHSLICPNCNHSTLQIIEIIKMNEIEIREAIVLCNTCKSRFLVNDGIINLLINPGPEIINEQKGWTVLKDAVKNTDELMLSLPEGLGEHKNCWRGQAENFFHIISKIKLKGDEKILDLGAGRCWASRYFAKYGCDVVAIDILLPKYVGLLTSDIYINSDKVYFERILSDMNFLPFVDNIFDYVFVSASLHHSLNLPKTLDEIRRVIKNSGKLIIINEPVRGFVLNNRDDSEEIKAGINENDYRLKEYLNLLQIHGFSNKLEFWLGGKNKLVNTINRILSKILSNEKLDRLFWKPIKYVQLWIFGGVFNSFATKIK